MLTDGDRTVAATEDYLGTLGDVERYAVGGPASRAHPDATALREPTRIDTAVAVAERFFPDPAAVGIATAWNFPDAVAGGTHSARHLGPILLTHPDRLPDPVATWLGSRAPSIEVAFVYGGRAAVTDEVVAAIDQSVR